MSTERDPKYLVSLVHEQRKLPRETEWVEFKENNNNPQEIGEYISALANSAALSGKAFAYLLWGISDKDHSIVGTDFKPHGDKIGNEELENWLLRSLAPKIHFRFFEISIEGKPVVILEIERARNQPVQFQGVELIRVGSYKKKLKDFPERERTLWRIFDKTPFEDGIALENIDASEVLQLLDWPAYFELQKRFIPENRNGIVEALSSDNLIRQNQAGGWNISNLGAILFARRLDKFGPSLARKAVRVIQYRGNSRMETIKEQSGAKGYACGFEGLIDYINGLLPSNEIIEQALRKTVPLFPELAVRELVANALIHQDFFILGGGPMIEIFDNRVEITNPGLPLMDTQRFVDTPPKSRNDALASLMRRMGICEERGSGWDKVVFQTEFHQLPAPLAEVTDEHTRVVLFAPIPLRDMDKTNRMRAVYLHACLRYVNRDYLTNTSLRERFGIDAKNSAAASRLIRESVDGGLIMPDDPNAAPKLMRYVPFWAASPRKHLS